MKLDKETIVSYPNQSVWSDYYNRFRGPLLNMLRRNSQSSADCEDAVEEAFHKLMHKKDYDSYGDKKPETESSWFWALYWQSRAYLSHLKSRCETHAKYVERTAKELEEDFAGRYLGEAIDSDIRTRSLMRALETLKAKQGVSPRDLEIYVNRKIHELPSKVVAEKYGITANNVDQVTWRVGCIVRKHGPRHFKAALRRERYGHVA
ncbi:MAG: sigma-70 family RNA polymerase sigma factor [Kiritimatiellae bacterium]|nr:sigma-70 family RNA polymerase sigma factor [Kiritimatiellia bacterium]